MKSISRRFALYAEKAHEIDLLIVRYEELEATAGDAATTAMERFGRSGSVSDRVGRTTAALDALERDIRAATEQEAAERSALNALLYTKKDGMPVLSPNERVVIQMRYFDRRPWERIEETQGFSIRGAQMMLKRGLSKLDALHGHGSV